MSLLQSDPTSQELRAWEEEAQATAEGLARKVRQRQGRLAELKERRDAVRKQLKANAEDPMLRETLERRGAVLKELLAFHSDDLDDLVAQQRLHERFLVDVRERSGHVPFRERLASLRAQVSELWNYEITVVDDDPITVGNATLAFVLLVLGFSVSRRASNGVRHLLESRVQLEPGVAGAIQTMIFYVLLVSFALVALRAVNFPLTAFTVAGGALAIGIGFGSQNVMNNFISGLILMLERPIRGHDVVEVEGTHGTIERIGARSTRIRANDGRHIIVPNAFFLENNVVNWTLSDDLIRTKVIVGVIYGSPTRLVEKLIRQTLEENDKILRGPVPIINFAEFGDNSLNFEAHFWLRARSPMAVEQVKSEVRFRIDDLFRENDLVIAFPQRDVHVDSVSPIEIRVVQSDPAPKEESR
jgi:small-conductance mechanosensitive channel